MEGQPCSEPGCTCNDFLPFECTLCQQVYCLEHRSRFVHTCSGVKTEAKVAPTSSSHPSVKDMMRSVEHRFDNEEKVQAKQHHNVKTSMNNVHPTDQKFARKLNSLNNTAETAASNKQRKISMKAREMMIKTKATGNSSIAGNDRHYIAVHFTNSLEVLHTDVNHQVAYMFFSGSKPIGEVLQYLWLNFHNAVERTDEFQQNAEFGRLHRDNISLVMTTPDTPDWQHWDRNAALRDCLANFEDVAVFAVATDDILMSQHAEEARRAAAIEAAHRPQSAAAAPAAQKVHREPVKYAKEQVAWYHKVAPEVWEYLTNEEMEATQPMIMVTISGIHLDDFPNVYYSVKLKTPLQSTNVAGFDALIFNHEKQTDATHLLPVSEVPPSKSASAGSAGNAAAERAEREASARTAALALQQTLAAIGTPVKIKVGFSNRDHNLTIGSQCTVAQLKMLISAMTDVSVPDMSLICKGAVLKNNNQLIQDTKITNGSKVVVMSSAAHVV